MPDLASWRLASTSWVLFPMDETIPIPVMTTRLMIASPCRCILFDGRCQTDAAPPAGARNSLFRLRRGTLFEQPDLQILRAIDNLVIGRKPPVGDAQYEL